MKKKKNLMVSQLHTLNHCLMVIQTVHPKSLRTRLRNDRFK